MLAAQLLVGGKLPLDARTLAAWPPAGAWQMPVGDPYTIAYARPAAPGPYFVLRNVEWDGGRASHQGADLACGSAGSIVRAAATGIAIDVGDRRAFGGYGTHVVLAHRLGGGVLAYSVYAHMQVGSLRVKPGQIVRAGQPLGRVGMTGHATGPHLHFELRATDDPAERWQLGRVEDPVAFVDERLPTHRADTSRTATLLEWGECCALLSPGARADDALTREAWWRMLASAVTGPVLDPALEANALRDSLIGAGVLPLEADRSVASRIVPWTEVARDLARARKMGLRSGTSPFRKPAHQQTCVMLVGMPAPAVRTGQLAGYTGRPTLAQAVALLADVAGPEPEPRPTTRAAKPGGMAPAFAAAGASGRSPGGRARADARLDSTRAIAAREPLAAHRSKAARDSSHTAHGAALAGFDAARTRRGRALTARDTTPARTRALAARDTAALRTHAVALRESTATTPRHLLAARDTARAPRGHAAVARAVTGRADSTRLQGPRAEDVAPDSLDRAP